jgi:hypothetical protein
VLAEKDGLKNVYFAKGFYKNIFIKLKKLRFVVDPLKRLDIICLAVEKPFLCFQTNGFT